MSAHATKIHTAFEQAGPYLKSKLVMKIKLVAEVLYQDRYFATKVYDQGRERIRETVAFLRRSQGPPDLYYKRRHDMRLTTPVAPTSHTMTCYM